MRRQLFTSHLTLTLMIDQDSVPEEEHTWSRWTFVTYWCPALATISGWTAASSIMTTGLSATHAILIVFVAGTCNAIPTVLNGSLGADLHISFTVTARASFGYCLGYFRVVSRGIPILFRFVESAQGRDLCVGSKFIGSVNTATVEIDQWHSRHFYIAQLCSDPKRSFSCQV